MQKNTKKRNRRRNKNDQIA